MSSLDIFSGSLKSGTPIEEKKRVLLGAYAVGCICSCVCCG